MDETPATVDALYEAWVAKLKRENVGLRSLVLVLLGVLVALAAYGSRPLPLPPMKEAPE
jgi:hypothetical protein